MICLDESAYVRSGNQVLRSLLLCLYFKKNQSCLKTKDFAEFEKDEKRNVAC